METAASENHGAGHRLHRMGAPSRRRSLWAYGRRPLRNKSAAGASSAT